MENAALLIIFWYKKELQINKNACVFLLQATEVMIWFSF